MLGFRVLGIMRFGVNFAQVGKAYAAVRSRSGVRPQVREQSLRTLQRLYMSATKLTTPYPPKE